MPAGAATCYGHGAGASKSTYLTETSDLNNSR